jgi:hypothetical protein
MSGELRTQSIEMNTTATLLMEEREGCTDPLNAQIVSISPGSMALRVNRSIPSDSRMQVTLTFIAPEGERHQESVQGWLVWQEAAPPFWLLGVIFPEINERENPILIGYLFAMDQ